MLLFHLIVLIINVRPSAGTTSESGIRHWKTSYFLLANTYDNPRGQAWALCSSLKQMGIRRSDHIYSLFTMTNITPMHLSAGRNFFSLNG